MEWVSITEIFPMTEELFRTHVDDHRRQFSMDIASEQFSGVDRVAVLSPATPLSPPPPTLSEWRGAATGSCPVFVQSTTQKHGSIGALMY